VRFCYAKDHLWFFSGSRHRIQSSSLKPPRTMRIADRGYRWRTKIKNWLPVVAWAGLIFFFSTEQFSSSNTSPIVGTLAFWIFPGISSETIETVHLTIRKLGHWTEYFVLAVLMLRALRNETGKKLGVAPRRLYPGLHSPLCPQRRIAPDFRSQPNRELRRRDDRRGWRNLWNFLDGLVWQRYPNPAGFAHKRALEAESGPQDRR
jgi:hypothetical protein